MTTYTSEPGTRLGGRYRLEDRIAAGSGWAAWKAIDETLARAVTVFTFAAGFPRVTSVVTAARAASRLTDPRLAQVFDVEDAWDHAYIVMEWAAGETLGDLLSHGPLEPFRAARMIAEAATAISSAHGAGVAHICLSPGSVRWSQTGEVKVVGLGIDAALSGVSSEDPVLADTVGLGMLLYAALTGHWPGPEYPLLPSAPVADGQPCSPRQVVAGIPVALSDLTCQAMQLRLRDPGPALTKPADLARALLAAIPPAPLPSAPPPPSWRDDMSPYPPASARGQYWPGSDEDGGRRRRGGRAEADWPGETGARTDATGYPQANGYATTDGQDPRGDGWPDSLDGSSWSAADQGRLGGRSRHGRRRSSLAGPSGPGRRRAPRVAPARVTIGIALAAVAGVALLAVAAFSLWPGSGKTPSRSHTTSVQQAVVLRPASAAGFDPLTSHKNDPGDEHSSLARYAIDDSMRTAWSSQGYLTSAFGGLKAGSGLIVDMGKPVRFAKVTVTFGSSPGADINLLAGNSADLSQANLASMTTIASANDAMGTMTFTIRSSAAERYLVVWFTKLPHQPGSKWYTAVIYNVQVQGSS